MLFGTPFHYMRGAGRVLAATRTLRTDDSPARAWMVPGLGYAACHLDSFVDAPGRADTLLSHMSMIPNGPASWLSLVGGVTLVALLGAAVKPRVGLVIVRPHEARIKQRVLAVLKELGVDTNNPKVIETRTSDDDALSAIEKHRPQALLIPFNAHADLHGKKLNGLDLAKRVDSELEELRHIPIYMPASPMARVIYELEVPRGVISESLQRRLVFIHLEEVRNPIKDLKTEISRIKESLK